MFFRLLAVAVVSVPLLAVAIPRPQQSSPASPCPNQSLESCSSLTPANSTSAEPILAALGLVVDVVEGLVGIGCSPITVLGIGSGSSGSSETVCCDHTYEDSAIGIGCHSITL